MSDTSLISVIIPTYNRKQSLLRLLGSLAEQTLACTDYEVIIADDGSSDGTGDMVGARRFPYDLRYSWEENRGVNAARNRGLSQAEASVVLFLDDDMVADSHLLEAHISAHQLYPGSVVKGKVIQAFEGEVEDQFAKLQVGKADLDEVDDTAGLQPISYQRIGAGHVSMPRREAVAIGAWDEGLMSYGFQDLEFMYRACKQGLPTLYDPQAVTFHHDYALTLWQNCDRIRKASSTATPDLYRRHPELEGQIPMFWDKGYVSWREDDPQIILRKLVRGAMIWSPALWGLEKLVSFVERICPKPALLKPLYRWVIGSYICLGYREGQRSVQHG